MEKRRIHRIFANTPAGFTELLTWLHEQGTYEFSGCLESTGSYSDAIVRFLQAQGYGVSLLNPVQKINSSLIHTSC